MNFDELRVETCSSASVAAARGDIETLQKLVKCKRSTNGQDNRGWRALHYACHGGHIDCIKILLKAHDVNINAHTFERLSPLFLTCCSDLEPELKTTVARLLLEAGADPNHENQRQYITILNQAISTSNFPLTKLLLEHGVNINEHDDKFGSTLNAAIETQNLEIVNLITDHRRLRYETQEYREAIAFFHITVLKRNADMLKLLLQKPQCLKEINHEDDEDRTCLYLACSVGFKEGVKLLLDFGAEPNIRCHRGDLPVMAYAEHIQDEDLSTSESIFGNLIRLTNISELKKPKTCNKSFFHMLAHWDKQDQIFEYILNNFPNLYSSTIVATIDHTITSHSTFLRALSGECRVSPLAYWCGVQSEYKTYDLFHRMVQIDYHIRDTTRERLPPIITAVTLETVDPYVIRYLVRHGADVTATIRNGVFPLAFMFALFSPTCAAIEALLVDSIPFERIFKGKSNSEIAEDIFDCFETTERWLNRGSDLPQGPSSIHLIRNLICMSKFLHVWPSEFDNLLHKLLSRQEIQSRNDYPELLQQNQEIRDYPKFLWHLASLRFRTAVWEKNGGITGVPICLCLEEYRKKQKVAPNLERLIFLNVES